MREKRRSALIAVITGLTDAQASNIQREVVKAKRRYAPGCRGTSGIADMNNVGDFLQSAWSKGIERKD